MTDNEGPVHVPTVAELYKAGKAERVELTVGKKQTRQVSFKPTAEGQAEVTEAMRHNAKYFRDHPEVSNDLFLDAVRRAREGVE